MPDVSDTSEVIVGRVVKAHGVRGAVLVESHTDEPGRRFAAGAVVACEADGRQWTVQSSHPQGNRLVVVLDGLTTRNEAETLAGVVLTARVPRDEQPFDQAEYYDRHLVGLAVATPDGQVRGRVAEVMHGPAQDILVVRTAGGDKLVPFVEALVPQVDLAAGSLTVADLPGLLDEAGEA